MSTSNAGLEFENQRVGIVYRVLNFLGDLSSKVAYTVKVGMIFGKKTSKHPRKQNAEAKTGTKIVFRQSYTDVAEHQIGEKSFKILIVSLCHLTYSEGTAMLGVKIVEPVKNPDAVEEIFEDIDFTPAFDAKPREEEI